MKKNWTEEFTRIEGEAIARWQEFLRFQSISAIASYASWCDECLYWLEGVAQDLGFSTEIVPTSGRPMLRAKRAGRQDRPHLLVYGHYDVQPVDPLELWESDPFEPTIRGDRLYARGAQDNKGQLSFILAALQSVIEADLLDAPVTLLIEGEEEIGSVGLTKLLNEGELGEQADLVMACDSSTFSPAVATIVAGLRGINTLEISLRGAKRDLHSGYHGGIAPNPIIELSKIIAGMFDDQGRIALPGYLDRVKEPTEFERSQLAAHELSPDQYCAALGVLPIGGEAARGVREREGFCSTIEPNGIIGGFTEEGSKTIVPSEARVKLTSRLAGEQRGEECLKILKDYLAETTPPSMTLEILHEVVQGDPLLVDTTDSRFIRVQEVAARATGLPVAIRWMGGSIPVLTQLCREARAFPVLAGFGLEEDAIHAPNESFSLTQFKRGYQFACEFLSSLGEFKEAA